MEFSGSKIARIFLFFSLYNIFFHNYKILLLLLLFNINFKYILRKFHFEFQKMFVFLGKEIKTEENGTSGNFAARKI